MKFRTRTRRLRAVSSPFVDHPDCAHLVPALLILAMVAVSVACLRWSK